MVSSASGSRNPQRWCLLVFTGKLPLLLMHTQTCMHRHWSQIRRGKNWRGKPPLRNYPLWGCTSYTGGRERKPTGVGELVLSLVLPEHLLFVCHPSSSSTSSGFSSSVPSYQFQDTGHTSKAKMPGALDGNHEEHLNSSQGVFFFTSCCKFDEARDKALWRGKKQNSDLLNCSIPGNKRL